MEEKLKEHFKSLMSIPKADKDYRRAHTVRYNMMDVRCGNTMILLFYYYQTNNLVASVGNEYINIAKRPEHSLELIFSLFGVTISQETASKRYICLEDF